MLLNNRVRLTSRSVKNVIKLCIVALSSGFDDRRLSASPRRRMPKKETSERDNDFFFSFSFFIFKKKKDKLESPMI